MLGLGVVEVVLVLLIIAGLFVAALLSARERRSRADDLAQAAERLGLMFSARADANMARHFGFLDKLNQGANRYALNIMFGNYRGHAVHIFDYHYETYSRDSDGDRQTHDHYFSFLVLTLERDFPELIIAPEGVLAKIAQALGYEDIDFESAEFSRTFCVRCKDKKFAYDFCNAQMMEYLLFNKDLAVEVEGPVLAIGFPFCLAPSRIEQNLERLIQLRLFMPKYLFENGPPSLPAADIRKVG